MRQSPEPGRAPRSPRTSARARRSRPSDRLAAHLAQHLQIARHSLRQFLAAPLQSLATALVIAIALALPTGLYLGLTTVRQLADGLDAGNRITLYLPADTAPGTIEGLLDQLHNHAMVAETTYISPQQGLDEFKEHSGFGDVLELLERNPLPPVVVVTIQEPADPATLDALAGEVARWPGVELVRVDSQWLARLRALAGLGRQLTLMLAAGLALGVVLVVGNTIRLAIENRREEILVLKLVGGTDAFVRRPFLYLGFWHGLGGGLLAWLLTAAGRWWLQPAVDRLAALYQTHWPIAPVDAATLAVLASAGALLGAGGAWFAAGRQMKQIEP